VLDRPLVAEPGTLWNYNDGHAVVLAELEQRSGRSLLDLVRTDLFEPLGITRREWRGGSPRSHWRLGLAPVQHESLSVRFGNVQ
jgi:CubicO group peptidase (beta-lactamase class C family)